MWLVENIQWISLAPQRSAGRGPGRGAADLKLHLSPALSPNFVGGEGDQIAAKCSGTDVFYKAPQMDDFPEGNSSAAFTPATSASVRTFNGKSDGASSV